MKRFNTFINDKTLIDEGLSDTLFHITNTGSAESILKSNKFMLTLSLGTPSDDTSRKSKNKIYYFSTARTPNARYFESIGYTGLYFELDGKKLGQRYSGKTVDYWGPEFGRQASEAEDRLFSTSSTIPNAISYIKAIHVFFDLEDQKYIHQQDLKSIRNILTIAKQKKIPIYFYDNDRNWRTRNIRKTFNPLKSGLFGSTEPLSINIYAGRKRRNPFDPWIELAHSPVANVTRLSKDGRELLDTLQRGYNYERDRIDIKRGLENDIHNYKARGGSDSLVKAMRHLKTTNVEDFIEKIYKRWSIAP